MREEDEKAKGMDWVRRKNEEWQNENERGRGGELGQIFRRNRSRREKVLEK